MVYIEFYDETSVENVVSCLAAPPEKVYLLGGDAEKLTRACNLYTRFFAEKGLHVPFLPVPVETDRLTSITDAVTSILETETDCAIDLTGGADLCLVATGIAAERHRDKRLQMHRFNLRESRVTDCDGDGNVISDVPAPCLGVEEYIRVCGGVVLDEEEAEGGTYHWDMDDADFRRDILRMWDICRGADEKQRGYRLKPREAFLNWNNQLNVLAAVEGIGKKKGLTRDVKKENLEFRLNYEGGGGKPLYDRTVLEPLRAAGLCTVDMNAPDGHVTVAYKNDQVRRCLTKAGTVLEMTVYLLALQEGQGYTDALNGVFIDWDGRVNLNGKNADTRNEIDVMMMHCLQPVFVSCKNGRFDRDELFMLYSVAERFGGSFAKRALVATGMDRLENAKYLRERAAELDITLIEPVEMSLPAFAAKIRDLWK